MPYLRIMTYLLKTIFFLSLSTKLLGQNITGEWMGEIYLKRSSGEYSIFFPVYFEIRHDSITNAITGVSTTKSYDTVIVDCLIEGAYDPQKNVYTLLETKAVTSNKETVLSLPVLNRFKMAYEYERKKEWVLSGSCECINPLANPLCYQKLKIILRRYKGK